MTEKEMHKLADIIVDKIIKKQAEYDAEFVKNLQNSIDNPEVEITYYSTSTANTSDKSELERLEEELQKALDEENYKQAARLVNEINKYKRNTNDD